MTFHFSDKKVAPKSHIHKLPLRTRQPFKRMLTTTWRHSCFTFWHCIRTLPKQTSLRTKNKPTTSICIRINFQISPSKTRKTSTLPRTNIAPEKLPDPNRKGSYSNHPFFRGEHSLLNFGCVPRDFLGWSGYR